MGQAHRRGVSTYAYVPSKVPSEGTKVQYTYVYSTTYFRTSEKFYEGTFVLSITSGSHTRTVQLLYSTFVVRKYFRTFVLSKVRKYFRTFVLSYLRRQLSL